MDNKPCASIDDRQITLGISEYLSSRIRDKKLSSEIIVTLQDVESVLMNKFKCILPFDRKNLTLLIEGMIESRNIYLKKSSHGSTQKFVFKNLASSPMIQPTDKQTIHQPKKSSTIPFITKEKIQLKQSVLKYLDGLSSCFAGRIKINDVDIQTQIWPPGILFIPNFIDDKKDIITIIKNQGIESVIIKCLKSILEQSGISSSNIINSSVLDNEDKNTLYLKSTKNTDTILIWVGLPASINLSFSDNNSNIKIPLFSGSLLKLDRSLSEWTGKIYTDNKSKYATLLFLSS